MIPTLWPSEIEKEIDVLYNELMACFDTDSPIDVKKVKRLGDLRLERMRELVGTHEQRLEMMKTKTRELTAFTQALDLTLKPDLRERLMGEFDKYDQAAARWVNEENCLWINSEASAIAAGILVLINEVR